MDPIYTLTRRRPQYTYADIINAEAPVAKQAYFNKLSRDLQEKGLEQQKTLSEAELAQQQKQYEERLAEQIRQWEENLATQKEQWGESFEQSEEQFKQNLGLQQQANKEAKKQAEKSNVLATTGLVTEAAPYVYDLVSGIGGASAPAGAAGGISGATSTGATIEGGIAGSEAAGAGGAGTAGGLGTAAGAGAFLGLMLGIERGWIPGRNSGPDYDIPSELNPYAPSLRNRVEMGDMSGPGDKTTESMANALFTPQGNKIGPGDWIDQMWYKPELWGLTQGDVYDLYDKYGIWGLESATGGALTGKRPSSRPGGDIYTAPGNEKPINPYADLQKLT